MRVVAGKARGHILKYPKEPRIRPTTDMIKEAIFSALESADTDWTKVLDLYAGTGALGIEALSRGAKEADFVEKNPKCCQIIRENLKRTGFTDQAKVYRLDASKSIDTLNQQYSLIFMDPPYNDQETWSILTRITDSSLAGTNTTIVVEHSRDSLAGSQYGDFHITNNLCHGDTCISMFSHCGGNN